MVEQSNNNIININPSSSRSSSSPTETCTIGLMSEELSLPRSLFKKSSQTVNNITKISLTSFKLKRSANPFPQRTEIDLNTVLETDSGSLTLISCVTNEYFATLFLTKDSLPIIKITVYQFKQDQICDHWHGELTLYANGKGKHVAIDIDKNYEKPELEGLLMNDGETLFLHIKLDFSSCSHFLFKKDGNNTTSNWIHQSRKGWEFRCEDYHLSDDEKYLYVICHEERGHQRKNNFIVKAFPIANMNMAIKKWKVECNYMMTDIKLLYPKYFNEPLYIAIKTVDHVKIQDLNNNVSSTLPIISSSQNIWISKYGKHLVYLPDKKGALQYWDLTNLTYQSLQECVLLGVECDITQKCTCRFSPRGEVITIITANNHTVNIQIMLS
jgi:hypothetical protein